MNRHISTWIPAYLDGELLPDHQRSLEAHLAHCGQCQAELESATRAAQDLSGLLAAWPSAPQRTSPAVFAGQVRLRLPRQTRETPWQCRLRLAWRSAPAAVAALWAFGQSATLMMALAWAASLEFIPGLGLGLSSGLTGAVLAPWLGDSLYRWDTLAAVLRSLLLSTGVSLAAGSLFLAWLASWWIAYRQNSPPPG